MSWQSEDAGRQILKVLLELFLEGRKKKFPEKYFEICSRNPI
jgi:hypothetical protein